MDWSKMSIADSAPAEQLHKHTLEAKARARDLSGALNAQHAAEMAQREAAEAEKRRHAEEGEHAEEIAQLRAEAGL